MLFRETKIAGAVIIEPAPAADERGLFARTWCQREFAERGLVSQWVQCNASFNRQKGTLRGLHFQAPPHAETKLVRCTRGAIYDVIVDLRPGSRSFAQWEACELSADNYRQLYVPEGVAHGFLTLSDNAEVYYQMSEFYHPEGARGVRWNDPALAIHWPAAVQVVSLRDAYLPVLANCVLPGVPAAHAAARVA